VTISILRTLLQSWLVSVDTHVTYVYSKGGQNTACRPDVTHSNLL